MPALSDYTAGTITLTNNSTAFTGSGTGWQAADFREGDTILGIEDNAGVEYVIATITGNGTGTLTQEWEGATGTYQYRMRYMADGARVTAQARNLIELLGNGNLQAEASLTGAADTLSYYTGPAAKALTPLTPFARTLLDDVDAAAARATLDVAQKQSSLTDSTAGRGMLVGAFGLGDKMDLRDTVYELGTPADLFGTGEVFGFARGGPDGVGVPALGSFQFGVLRTSFHWSDFSAGAGFHREFRIDNRIFTQRAISGTTWGTWRETFNRLDQIVEQGNNSNGFYTRFSSGTQFCWAVLPAGTANIASGAVFRSDNIPWTFPAAFSTTVIGCSAMEASGFGRCWGGLGTDVISATSATFTLFSAASVSNPQNISVQASGRWF